VTQALVVGGGLAGSAAACLLARAGNEVHLIERETGPHHKVCGEFLSVEAGAHLRDLGIDLDALGAAPIGRIHLVSGRTEAEAPLPFGALGLSRHVLDEVLLDAAAKSGARVERGARVSRIDGLRAISSSGERSGEILLLATGKLPLRETGDAPKGRAQTPYVGLKMHLRLAAAAQRELAETILLALFDGGYAGLQPIEDGQANLCLVMHREQFAKLGASWSAVRTFLDGTPRLRALLAGAQELFDKPVTIGNLAYGRRPETDGNPGVYRLGDQWAMTASITGDGMALALRSAFIAARSVAAREDGQTYRRRLAADAGGQVRRAVTLQRMLDVAALRSFGSSLARACPPLLSFAANATRLPEWQG